MAGELLLADLNEGAAIDLSRVKIILPTEFVPRAS